MRLILSLLSTMALCAIIGAGVVIFGIHYYSQDLPDHKELASYEPPLVSRMHAGDGRLMAEMASEQRIYVPYDAIPPRLVQAFVAAEDKNFFNHPGLDFVGIARAIVMNVKYVAEGRRLIGASTITQQVAKNFLLTSERKLERKVKEAILAFRIEQTYSKERILELYLNEIFLGLRSYGIAAAALNYFNKSLDELSLGEIAYLAGLPKAPNNYHPVRNKDAAVNRRNYVLRRMMEDGYISKAQYDKAKQQDVALSERDKTEIYQADYFAEEVRRALVAHYGEEKLDKGGLSIRTTVDPRIQNIADTALRHGLISYDKRHGWRGPVTRIKNLQAWQQELSQIQMPAGGEGWVLAAVLKLNSQSADIGFHNGAYGQIPLSQLEWARKWIDDGTLGPKITKPSDVVSVGDVVLVQQISERTATSRAGFALRQIPKIQGALVAMDPHTGRVLALSGGFSYEMSQFNRATQAWRQPGSAFKPFVYLAALDNGFTPSSLVLDAPIAIDQGHGQGIWRPSNYTSNFYGPTPLRVGIEKSRNLMTVRLAQTIKMETIAKYAKKLGIDPDMPPLLSAALGSRETTVLRLTNAYAMLVNGGKKINPTLIDRIQDRNGKTIFKHDPRSCTDCNNSMSWYTGRPIPRILDLAIPVADPRTAYQIVSMLQGVVERGTGRIIAKLGRPLAGKTGTTNNAQDAWFVGFSPDLAVGVYVGFDQPRPLGGKESGSTVAAPIFKDFMEQALAETQPIPFRVPSGIRLVKVNPKTGKLPSPGDPTILEAFIPGTEPTFGQSETVYEQRPAPVQVIEMPGQTQRFQHFQNNNIITHMPPRNIPTQHAPSHRQPNEPPPTSGFQTYKPVDQAPLPPPSSNKKRGQTGLGGLY